MTLYNCSFGRSDCSLCLAADPAYKCVWCSGQSRCVYEALCSNATSECPPPVITRVSPLGLPAGRGGGSRSRPTCTARWPRLPGQPGSADFRSSPRRAPWAGAFVSPSLGRIWESEQMMSRESLWLARTAPLSRDDTLCLPGEWAAQGQGSIGWVSPHPRGPGDQADGEEGHRPGVCEHPGRTPTDVPVRP